MPDHFRSHTLCILLREPVRRWSASATPSGSARRNLSSRSAVCGRPAKPCARGAVRAGALRNPSRGDRASLDLVTDRKPGGRPTRVRTSSADVSAVPRGRPAFLQGEFAGATFSKGGLYKRGPFSGGSLPHGPDFGPLTPGVQPGLLTSCRIRPCGGYNCCAGGADRVALQANACCATAFSPQQPDKNVALSGPQPTRRARRGDDSATSRHGDGVIGSLVPAPTGRALVGSGHESYSRHLPLSGWADG